MFCLLSGCFVTVLLLQLYASIDDYRATQYNVGKFKANLFLDAYQDIMQLLSTIKSDNLRAYHVLMHGLYKDAWFVSCFNDHTRADLAHVIQLYRIGCELCSQVDQDLLGYCGHGARVDIHSIISSGLARYTARIHSSRNLSLYTGPFSLADRCVVVVSVYLSTDLSPSLIMVVVRFVDVARMDSLLYHPLISILPQ